MRMLVFFDLPVNSRSAQKEATRFRNFLIKDGFHMMQYSVYCRVCNGYDTVETHHKRLKENLPDNGAIRLLVITEKQYESMVILLGNYKPQDDVYACEQLTLL